MERKRREALTALVEGLPESDKNHILIDVIGVGDIESRLIEALKLQEGGLGCSRCKSIAWDLGIVQLDQDASGMPVVIIG